MMGIYKGKGPNQRIRVRERRGRKHLIGQRKRETEIMRETVGGGGRRMLSLLQAAREDSSATVVAIANMLALRDPGQLLNPEEAKAPAIAKMGQSITVASGPFRCRYKSDGQ